ncbi:MAG: arginine--tRNA ligase [Anaerolineaceae bacterium]|jgi:arginyl-tRNA synthetase|nr:arginine--tRNA ligase [Anaerolineaceae bacterium]MDD4042396.1 arginine--tRNA ligase [Anaerolineaceae bacterium]MDD4578540.1 arginine--tRNA ligase [Anaerolineaceae bacterium]
MFEDVKGQIAQRIDEFCLQNDLPTGKVEFRSIPFSGEWGMAAPLFPLAAADTNKTGPVPQHAQFLAEKLKEVIGLPAGFTRAEAVKGYLNLYFDTALYAASVVEQINSQGPRFGTAQPTDETVMVEYSNPNTHKPLHVGHLRNVILGGSVCNILEASGKTVIRANYIGDIGLHVIKWMCNYEMYHAGEQPAADEMRWMADLYSEADRRFHEQEGFEDEVRAYFARWDAGDEHIHDLWLQTRQWSMDGFAQVYELLGEHFDRIYFESDVEDSGKEIVDRLIESGIATDGRPENPVIVDIDAILGTKEEYRVAVILRSDGTSLYATKELPLAIMKFEEYELDQSIYVIDVRQSLHMKQMRKILELMGYPWATKIHHLAYEIVNLPGNVIMSSRDGTVVLLDDLVREATQRALDVVHEKNPELDPAIMLDVAQKVALGAIKYPMISRENTKIVTFDWESALDFNGQSAPYIQYANVRANSILRRAGSQPQEQGAFNYTLEPSEVNLIELLSKLPDEVSKSAKDFKPSTLAAYAYELAKAFNDFYNQCQVLKAEGEVRTSRLALVHAAKVCLEKTFNLLGIQAPQVM